MNNSLNSPVVDQLPPDLQAQFFRERVIQLRDAVSRILPIIDAHDKTLDEDDDPPGKAAYLRTLVDLNESAIRTLYLPSHDFALNGVDPEGLTSEKLWALCLDQVVAMNRGFGVNTASMVHSLNTSQGKAYDFWYTAYDPIGRTEAEPKSLMFRILSRILGEKRIQRFVNRNSQYYRPFWKWDVVDPRPIPKD